MSAASRRKGAAYERTVGHAFTDAGVEASRRLEQWRAGGDDLELPADVAAWLSVECKNVASTSLGAWVDQSVASAGDRVAAVVHHRRGNGEVLDDFATVRLRDLLALTLALRYLTASTGDDLAALLKELRP